MLGYQPNIPGSLLDTNVNYSHLDPSEAFQHKMECRVRAATAVVKADNDLRLRRALLRQHRGDPPRLLVGQKCFYWREAAGSGPRIRWKGPATVVLTESQKGPGQTPNVYWLVHGTALIRAAPEHVRPDLESDTLAADTPALHSLVRKVQNRGTTVYVDLFKTNRKRRREDIAHSDDEILDDDDDQQPPPDGPPGRPAPSTDTTQPSLHSSSIPDSQGHVPGAPPPSSLPRGPPAPQPVNHPPRGHAGGPPATPTTDAATTPLPHEEGTDSENMDDDPSVDPEGDGAEDTTTVPSTADRPGTASGAVSTPPSVHPSFSPAEGETFEQKRARIDRTETISHATPPAVHESFRTPQTPETFAQRVLKAHFILKWSKHPDGSPRAKARLITQGFRDPDALAGLVDSTSPTLTRLGRTTLMSLASTLAWDTFIADITTAFLQGKEHSAERTLWIRLPADARQLLGVTDSKVPMRTKKPVYGLCDAPRAWFVEATRRLTSLGFVQHPLDSCLFLLFGPRLQCAIGLHVDDLIGISDPAIRQKVKEDLQKLFSFRDFRENQENFDFLGVQVARTFDNGLSCSHDSYLNKIKPIPLEKGRTADPESPATEKERTQLRALIGALQWAATQTSPHLQVHTSMLAGEVTKATVSTLIAANKALRFAKANSDVQLLYPPLGDNLEDIVFVAYSDAAFATRSDLSSQGGYLICASNRAILDGAACHYHLLDWRSFRLPRVARSTLSAEGQAAAEATDNLHFVVTFWRAILDGSYRIDGSDGCFKWFNPCVLVIDAKCLYDVLHREELYVSTAADKRTCLEALVTRDKLKEIGGEARWVSSERQFADGLTKDTATQLLADRLRTHLHKLTADETYQASRKKKATDRAQSANQFARPKAAAAMFAAAAILPSTADGRRWDDIDAVILYQTVPEIYVEAGPYIFFIALLVLLLVYLRPWMLSEWPISLRRFVTAPCQSDVATQTDNDTEIPQVTSDAQTDATFLQQPLPDMRIFMNRGAQTNSLIHGSSHRSLETLHLDLEVVRDYNRRLATAVQQQQHLLDYHTSNRLSYHHVGDIYITPYGRVWHVSEDCAQSRTDKRVQSRTPCAYCTNQCIPPVPAHLRYNPQFAVQRVPDTTSASSSSTTLPPEPMYHLAGETGAS